MNINKKNESGFTLLEVALVVVVIAIIVATIVTASGMVTKSKLRAQIAQLEVYKTAYTKFRTKWNAIPGDMIDASSMGAFVNGNGDGVLNPSAGDAASDNYRFDGELDDFFVHLSIGDLVDSNFDGSNNLGLGYPELEFKKGAGMFATSGAGGSGAPSSDFTPTTLYSASTTKNIYLSMVVCDPSQVDISADFADCSIFRPIDALYMDKKLDDGLPLSGIFLGFGAKSPTGDDCLVSSGGEMKYNGAFDDFGCLAMFDLE